MITIATWWIYFTSRQNGPMILTLGGQCLHLYVSCFLLLGAVYVELDCVVHLQYVSFAVKCLGFSNRLIWDS